MATITTSLLLSQQDVADLLRISVRSLAHMRKRDGIPNPVPLSGKGTVRQLHWRREDIERWVAMGCPDRQTYERMRKG